MEKAKQTYRAVGLMSGTSLDGLDIVLCSFERISIDKVQKLSGAGAVAKNEWSYEILRSTTVPYSPDWRKILSHSHLLPDRELVQLDVLYGQWIGEQVKDFLGNDKVDIIGSHGHTVHHLPFRSDSDSNSDRNSDRNSDSDRDRNSNRNSDGDSNGGQKKSVAGAGRSVQIGSGQAIADATGIPVIFDFRQPDLDLGGQGAPLVPIGDQLLFGDHAACLNLGGFMNASWEEDGVRKAGDIGPMNIGLNHVARLLGKEYDENGDMARSGTLIPSLFDFWNGLEFFKQPPPKSLGREFMDKYYFPYFGEHDPVDVLATLTQHAALQLAEATMDHGPWTMNKKEPTVQGSRSKAVLTTGGGAYNTYFRELVTHYGGPELTLPDPQLINYKEALIFAFMAVLKQRGEVNVLSSVTGAERDHASGREAHPKKQ